MGAYNQYRNALFAGDAEGVWTRLAPSSHAYFDEQHQRLVKMDDTIRRYLPPTDHKLAREQAGSILTDDVTDGKGLFMKVFNPKGVPQDEAYKVGMDVDTEAVAEDELSAKITTRGGQTYIMTRVTGEGEKPSEQWFVMLINSSDAVGKQLGWLNSNETALEKTIEDLIEEEKKQREALIAQLMDVEQKGEGDAEKSN